MSLCTPSKRPCAYIGMLVSCQSRSSLSISPGCLLVDEHGTISHVINGQVETEKIEQAIEEFGWEVGETNIHRAAANEFFFPGFIDTHIHASQFPNCGLFGQSTLLEWLEKYTYPLESSLADLNKARKVYETCVSSTISHGTTTAAYYATTHVKSTSLLASICKAKGQRALIGRVCMDHPSTLVEYYRDSNVETSETDTLAVVEHIKSLDSSGLHLAPILTPRSAASCTPEQLFMLRDLSVSSSPPLRVQTHLSENLSEIDLVKELWPSHKNYTDIYDSHGLLTPSTILAHAVHLDQAERDLIALRGAKVSHCPVSNSGLGSGTCQVRGLLDDGICVGLGSDVSGGYSCSILEAARHACLVSRLAAAEAQAIQGEVQEGAGSGHDRIKLKVEEVLWMASRGGAEVVGWQDRLGAFEVGMQFDAQLVSFDLLTPGFESQSTRDLGNFKVFGWESWEDRIAKWVYCGDDRNTVKVWVDGDVIHVR
ncbi:guanine deaminase [Fusarium tricinctum]|uniref:Guanine deaminase n=1 Tax=Fusarium tricinctum TaxID=61284 RepID=A0A8K0RWM2_9HYPO|nr:guanine deaminase [Fusarium tricinctum]